MYISHPWTRLVIGQLCKWCPGKVDVCFQFQLLKLNSKVKKPTLFLPGTRDSAESIVIPAFSIFTTVIVVKIVKINSDVWEHGCTLACLFVTGEGKPDDIWPIDFSLPWVLGCSNWPNTKWPIEIYLAHIFTLHLNSSHSPSLHIHFCKTFSPWQNRHPRSLPVEMHLYFMVSILLQSYLLNDGLKYECCQSSRGRSPQCPR